MNVLVTAAARDDLRDIGEWLTLHYPAVAPHAERRFRDVFARIGRWPESGPHSAGREGVRVMPLGRYPYKIFYRITGNAVEILHIHHAARAVGREHLSRAFKPRAARPRRSGDPDFATDHFAKELDSRLRGNGRRASPPN